MDNLELWLHRVERCLIVALLGVTAFYVHLHDKDAAVKDAAKLAQQGLPPDQLAKFVLQQNQLIELVRNAKGQTEVHSTYIPQEGGVQIIAQNQQQLMAKLEALMAQLRSAKTSSDTAKIEGQINQIAAEVNRPPEAIPTTRGLTSRFGFGFVVSPGHTIRYRVSDGGSDLDLSLSPLLDWKWGYWSRYSSEVQVSVFYPGLAVSRHVDDWTPKWMHMNNSELFVSGGPGWTGGWAGGGGLRMNW